MTSHNSSLSTILSEPDVARLIAEPGPWWIWSSDASKLLLANFSGARAMGATGVAIAMERDYAPTHAFAGQVARLAPLLPADGTPRSERMRIAGRFGSESVVAEARRLRAGDVGLIALRLPAMRRGSPRAAAIAFVTDLRQPALAFDATGHPLAASEGAAALASTALRDLLGPDTDTALAAIAATGRATIPLVNGPMTLIAVPAADAVVAVLATPSGTTVAQGLRLVAPPAADEASAQAATPEDAAPESVTGASPAMEQDAPELGATEDPQAAAAAAATSAEVDAAAAEPAAVQAGTAPEPLPSGTPAGSEPQTDADAEAAIAPLEVPQRFSWRLDADLRFQAIVPDSVAAPAETPFDDAVRRFGLDPQGALADAVAARRPFSGVPAVWPLGSGGRRLAVTLAAFPTLRDGSFQGYAGFGLIVEELAAAERAVPAPEETGPAQAQPPIEMADTITEADTRPDQPVEASRDVPLAAADEAPDDAGDTIAADTAGSSRQTADAVPEDTGPATDSPPVQAADKGEPEPEGPRGPAAETRPVLTVHTNPPNVVALRTSVGHDLKRPQLSPGERNAFREIARALGARTEEEQVAADPAATQTPEPLPPPAEQSRPGPDVVPTAPTAPTDETTPLPIDRQAAGPPPEIAGDAAGEATVAPADDGPATPFVDSGTPFGPLPSAFGAESAPEASRAQADLASLLDRVPAGLVVHRGNAILFANRTLLDWIGFADAAALERAGGIARLFAGGPDETSGDAVTLTTEDGSSVPVEVNLSRIAWAGDSAFLFSLRRVEPAVETVADHESATLSELRGRLDEVEQILDTATDGIVIVTADGAIESMNRSAEALFGYESAEVKGRSITTLFAPESHRSALDYCDGLLSNGVASVLNDGRQIIGRVKQGGLIPLYMTMGRTGPASKPKLAAVFRDMTQWKKAEEDLIAAKRQAEQASSQKSDFLAKISHEIRTPLNAIIGFSEVMMEERFGPVGNERYRDYLKDIHASGGHVLSLINDLLDLSKIEAGKLELAFTSVDLNEMVQSTVATMQPQANRDRVIIRSSLQPRLPNVVADARSLRQIVLNLLSNSVKFTPAGGQIIVSTGLSDAGEAVLRVRDTGIGMTESELRAAMEPFRQVATSNPRAAKGTGLGLPLTKALVEANRASFGITSTPNQGTLVEVIFPPTRVLAE